jgi:hypothetical protein
VEFTIEVHGSNVDDEISEDGKALDLVLDVIEDAREDDVHALDVADLGILSSITHQDLLLLLLEEDIVEGARIALSTVDVLHDLLQVLPALLVHAAGLVGLSALLVRHRVGLGLGFTLLQDVLPSGEQLHIVVLYDFQGDIDPSKKFITPFARLSAAAALACLEDLDEKALDGIEDLDAG